MISQKMIDWGSQGCGIREIAAYGEARAAVVGAENVFNFTIGNPSVKAPDCSCPVARVPKARPFFIDRKDGEIRNIRGKQQMNEAQRATVMQIIDKHGRS